MACFAIPMFGGKDPLIWLGKVDTIWCEFQLSDAEFLELVFPCLVGKARSWIESNMHLISGGDWCSFSYHLLGEFEPTIEPPTTAEIGDVEVEITFDGVESYKEKIEPVVEEMKNLEFTSSTSHIGSIRVIPTATGYHIPPANVLLESTMNMYNPFYNTQQLFDEMPDRVFNDQLMCTCMDGKFLYANDMFISKVLVSLIAKYLDSMIRYQYDVIKWVLACVIALLEHQNDIKALPFTVTEGSDGFPLINVRYLGEVRSFTPTQVLGMVLSDSKGIAVKNLNAAVADCCIGIPGYYTDLQRRAVMDVATIAGLHPLRLCHETTATALGYGIYKTDLPENDQINVAFVDIGHASLYCCNQVQPVRSNTRRIGTALEVLHGTFAGVIKSWESARYDHKDSLVYGSFTERLRLMLLIMDSQVTKSHDSPIRDGYTAAIKPSLFSFPHYKVFPDAMCGLLVGAVTCSMAQCFKVKDHPLHYGLHKFVIIAASQCPIMLVFVNSNTVRGQYGGVGSATTKIQCLDVRRLTTPRLITKIHSSGSAFQVAVHFRWVASLPLQFQSTFRLLNIEVLLMGTINVIWIPLKDTVVGVSMLAVYMLYPFLAYFGYGLDWKEATILVWSGLRGDVALFLSLSVKRTSDSSTFISRDTGTLCVFFTGGSVFFGYSWSGGSSIAELYSWFTELGFEEHIMREVQCSSGVDWPLRLHVLVHIYSVPIHILMNSLCEFCPLEQLGVVFYGYHGGLWHVIQTKKPGFVVTSQHELIRHNLKILTRTSCTIYIEHGACFTLIRMERISQSSVSLPALHPSRPASPQGDLIASLSAIDMQSDKISYDLTKLFVEELSPPQLIVVKAVQVYADSPISINSSFPNVMEGIKDTSTILLCKLEHNRTYTTCGHFRMNVYLIFSRAAFESSESGSHRFLGGQTVYVIDPGGQLVVLYKQHRFLSEHQCSQLMISLHKGYMKVQYNSMSILHFLMLNSSCACFAAFLLLEESITIYVLQWYVTRVTGVFVSADDCKIPFGIHMIKLQFSAVSSVSGIGLDMLLEIQIDFKLFHRVSHQCTFKYNVCSEYISLWIAAIHTKYSDHLHCSYIEMVGMVEIEYPRWQLAYDNAMVAAIGKTVVGLLRFRMLGLPHQLSKLSLILLPMFPGRDLTSLPVVYHGRLLGVHYCTLPLWVSYTSTSMLIVWFLLTFSLPALGRARVSATCVMLIVLVARIHDTDLWLHWYEWMRKKKFPATVPSEHTYHWPTAAAKPGNREVNSQQSLNHISTETRTLQPAVDLQQTTISSSLQQQYSDRVTDITTPYFTHHQSSPVSATVKTPQPPNLTHPPSKMSAKPQPPSISSLSNYIPSDKLCHTDCLQNTTFPETSQHSPINHLKSSNPSVQPLQTPTTCLLTPQITTHPQNNSATIITHLSNITP